MASKIQASAAAEGTPLPTNCSICLEEVIDNNSRAITKLICGHTFHLSCIGSQFNIKGEMQCPNCRSTEESEWLYSIGAPGLDIIPDDSDEEMDNADDEELELELEQELELDQEQDQDQDQHHNYQNQFQCPHGVPNCPGFHDENLRPIRVLHIGGSSSNAGFPDAGVHQRNYLPSTPAPPAPPPTPIRLSNINEAAIIISNHVLSHRPPAGPDPIGHGGHESSHFPPNLATNPILHGTNPLPTVLEALLAIRGGPHRATPQEMNVGGLEASVNNQGIDSTTSANRVERNAEQLPPPFPSTGDYSGNPNEAVNPEEPNADSPRMIRFL